MYPISAGQRRLTELDLARLSKLNGAHLSEALAAGLGMAERVPSPIGAALPVSDIASWRVPNGKERPAEVAEMLFQHEASGDYTA